jgi:hypothetical protein
MDKGPGPSRRILLPVRAAVLERTSHAEQLVRLPGSRQALHPTLA